MMCHLTQQTNALCTYYEQQIANDPPAGAERWSDSAWLRYLSDEAMRRAKATPQDNVVELPAWCKARKLNPQRVAPMVIAAGIPLFRYSTNGKCGKNHFLKEHEAWVEDVVKKTYATRGDSGDSAESLDNDSSEVE